MKGVKWMRVLIATSFPQPSAGGVWTYISWLEKGLRQRGHEVEIFAAHPTLPEYYLLYGGKSVKKYEIQRLVDPKIRAFSKGILTGVHRLQLQALEIERYTVELALLYLGMDDYDLVHAQDVIATLALSRVASVDTPLVSTIHSSLVTELLMQGQIDLADQTAMTYMKMLEHAGLSASHLTILPSQWLKGVFLQSQPLAEDHLRVVPSGIGLSEFRRQMDDQPTLVFEADKRHLVCPARLDAIKGHRVLLEALWRLKRDRSDWVCWFLGDGPLRLELQQQSRQLGLEGCVRFAGTRADIPALLRQADVVVLASLQENQPYAVMEAQFAGKPVVVTRAGGLPEMVTHEETGLVSPIQDSHALYVNLKRILTDDLLREGIAKRGQAFAAAAWNLETMMDRITGVYQDAAGRCRARGTQVLQGPYNRAARKGKDRVLQQDTGHPERSGSAVDRFRFYTIPAKAYDVLFSEGLPSIPVRVERVLWDTLLHHAPASYTIPDSLLIRAIEQSPSSR